MYYANGCTTEISRFNVSAFTVIISLTIAILFCFSYSPSINSQLENDSRSVSFDNKCADYHASSPSDAGIYVGGHPSGLSVDQTKGTIYTVDSISKKIAVIDGSTDTLTRTISIANIKPDTSGNYERVQGYIAIDPVTDLLSVASSIF